MSLVRIHLTVTFSSQALQSLGFAPLLSAFALPPMLIGIHHGYAAGALFSIVPLNRAGLFSKNDLKPSLLSLPGDQLSNLR